VHVTSNRFSEPAEAWESVNLSILSYGFLMNTTALNIMTHCHFVIDRGGLISPPPVGSPEGTPPSQSGGFIGFQGTFRIEAMNNVMFSHYPPQELFPEVTFPQSPCVNWVTPGNIWQIMADFTKLVYDKR